MKRRWWIVVVLLLLAAAVWLALPAWLESSLNPVVQRAPYSASAPARELHRKLFIVDLHADSLLWDRNLLQKSSRGQVDVPRLIEGNVALEVFTIVSKVPRGQNLQRNDDRSDVIGWLGLAEGWPPSTWGSLKQRALYQASVLRRDADQSQGRLTLIRSSADLESYLVRRRQDPDITAGLLGIEGGQVLEGNLDNLDALYAAGFRMMGLTHFFDNDLGGSAHGVNKGGLTPKGRELIARMEARHMIVDLAHASPQTIDEALAVATRPMVVSHTGVKGTCDSIRNLSDRQLLAVAHNGGLIGIGYWPEATCGNDAAAAARAIRYAANLVGADHVALGSDFDGSVQEPFDTSGLVQLTDALLAQGFTPGEIQDIMGGNALRFFLHNLPPQ